jgi:lysophospholipid acyltransferase (LPLAT)-like uncharacterized protein
MVPGKINLYLPLLVDTIKNKMVPLDLVSASILLCGSILGKTWRLSVTGTTRIDPFHDRDKGVIYCFWHAHILPMAYIFRGIGVKAVVSDSKDGDRATAVAQRWRHETIRGSSSLHGISVIRACVRELKRGQNIVFVPDGPRGPREIVKPGIAQIALLAGAPVFPVIALPAKCWRLNSWDRFMLPKPFSKIEIRIAEPLVPSHFEGDPDPVDSFTECLQKALTL